MVMLGSIKKSNEPKQSGESTPHPTAVSLLLDPEQGTSFVRLSKLLPSLSERLVQAASLAKGLAGDLIVRGSSEEVDADLSMPETVLALRAIEDLVTDSSIRKRFSAVADSLQSLFGVEVPQHKAEGFRPPQGVATAAARGLELRSKHGRGGTAVGVARARDLKNRASISLDTIGRMVSFFARHGAQGAGTAPKAGEDPSNGYIAWLLWGGDAGRTWANSVWERNQKKSETEKAHSFTILKKESEVERTVFGIVLEPETIDAQKDIYSEEEIRKTAYAFMERYQQFGLMHRTIVPAILPLESYLAPVDFEITDPSGTVIKVKKGTWLLRVRVLDDKIWADVQSGRLTGFSIGGSAIRTPEKAKA